MPIHLQIESGPSIPEYVSRERETNIGFHLTMKYYTIAVSAHESLMARGFMLTERVGRLFYIHFNFMVEKGQERGGERKEREKGEKGEEREDIRQKERLNTLRETKHERL